MTITPETIARLRAATERYGLDNRWIADKYSDEQLAGIYNGLGPDSFPRWLRAVLTDLNPLLRPVAFVHDIEWHESDGSVEAFKASNDRFRANGFKVADADHPLWSLRRWMVRHQAAKFARLCQKFGWRGWSSPCKCAVCRRKAERAAVATEEKAVESVAGTVAATENTDR